MSGFVDIHTHLAWNIDDGFPNREASDNALRTMKEDGIIAVCATPHVVPGQMDKDFYELMKNRIQELKSLAANYDITVYEGCEVFLNRSYLELLDEMLYFPLANSNYVLVEFDVRKDIAENDEVEDMLYEITIRDKVPIVAHAERYFHGGINMKRIQKWIDMGCFIQMNRTSLFGLHGKMAKKNAERLLEHGLVHVIASDAHSDKGNRICKLSDIYEVLVKDYGKQVADILCKRNPTHIIHNETLETIEAKKTSVLKRLWRK